MKRHVAAIAAAVVVIGVVGAKSGHTPAVTPVSAAAPAGVSAATYHGPFTPGSWARAFITGAGYRPTRCNMAAVKAWIRTEGTYWTLRNPLDDSLALPGSSVINGDQVRRYVHDSDGLQAALFTLQYHPKIKAALAAGNDAQAVADAVVQPSVSGHYWGTQSFNASC